MYTVLKSVGCSTVHQTYVVFLLSLINSCSRCGETESEKNIQLTVIIGN